MQSDLENSEKAAACDNEFGPLAICTEQCCHMYVCYELGASAIYTKQCCSIYVCCELGTLAECTEQCCCMEVWYELYVEGWVFK
jgi:hypothetical protein